MSKRRILMIVAFLACGAVLSVFAAKAFAVPPPGTFQIITYDPDTGERLPCVVLTITQLEADIVTVPVFKGRTNQNGILYHSTHSGLYEIKAQGGATSVTYLPSGAYEVPVSLPVWDYQPNCTGRL